MVFVYIYLVIWWVRIYYDEKVCKWYEIILTCISRDGKFFYEMFWLIYVFKCI